MTALKKMRSVGLLVGLLMAAILMAPSAGLAASVQAPVPLGTTVNFAVLAGSAVTNTGNTTIVGDAGGDVGVSTGSSIGGFPPGTMSGVPHSNDAGAILAQTDLVNAYTNAAGRTPVDRISSELGGQVLKPGVYDSADGTFQITGTLTLDADGDPDGVFIFLTDSSLITASNSRVTLIKSARYCRVFWKVGSSVTLGTDSHFVGHVFANTSITANSRASVQGQLLAHTGAVTLDDNDITNGLCVSAQGASVDITKTASPSTITTAPASVTYTYLVSTRGTAPLSSVTVTDDKVSPVTYVSGDDGDDLLEPGETWTYTGTATLTTTTTNTGTVTGIGNGVTVTDTSVATVTVAVPQIRVTKTASPTSLSSVPATVTYTYQVTNPGTAALTTVTVTDDKVSTLTRVSGDTNGDNLLQPGETWTYTGTVKLSATTTNTATARGSANGVTATATAAVTVRYTGGVSSTESGGHIPDTATPWYALFVAGLVLALVGAAGVRRAARRSHE